MKKTNKALPLVLASALAATPFVAVPHAQAISGLDISADEDGAGDDSEYKIEFTLDKALDSGDYIYVEFDSDYTVSKNISTSDIDANFDIKSVKVSGREIQIRIDEDLDKDDDVSFTIEDGITNPDSKGS